jgi:DNA sulfur modification protein DndE
MIKFLAVLTLIIGCAFQISGPQFTIYMIGDSTMADKPTEDNPERGWGQVFPRYFDSTVVIENHARNGRSTRSFLYENRWRFILDRMKPGDYVFIQFGHNDESIKKVERYTSPEDYRKNLIKFVTETREKKGYPILCTPIVRRRFDKDGKFYDEHGVYPQMVREVAAEYKVPLIDMHRKSEQLVTKLGVEDSKEIFLWIKPGVYKSLPDGKEDNTHFSEYGALKMADLAVEGLIEVKSELTKHLKKSF